MAKKKATPKPTARKDTPEQGDNVLHVSLDDCWVEQAKTGPCLALRVLDKAKRITTIYLTVDQDDLDGMEDIQGILWGELDDRNNRKDED